MYTFKKTLRVLECSVFHNLRVIAHYNSSLLSFIFLSSLILVPKLCGNKEAMDHVNAPNPPAVVPIRGADAPLAPVPVTFAEPENLVY